MIVSHSYSGFMRNNHLYHKQNYLTTTLHSAFVDLTFRARKFFEQKSMNYGAMVKEKEISFNKREKIIFKHEKVCKIKANLRWPNTNYS
jgi:hypothetical protein